MAIWASLYCDTWTVARGRQGLSNLKGLQEKRDMDTPLSQSYISLKLSEIQKRCSELMEAPDGLTELQLEEPETVADNSDPYNRT